MRPKLVVAAAVAASLALLLVVLAIQRRDGRPSPAVIGRYHHLVVIYEENHSFDNLYGNWGAVDGQQVDGLASADPAHTLQVSQGGQAYQCLLQNDVNLTSPSPLSAACTATSEGGSINSHFPNAPFKIDDYIGPDDTTCPPSGKRPSNGQKKGEQDSRPGGCTRDLVHNFYQEQYQLDGGRQDRYVAGSNAAGLAMGYYDTTRLPIWQYLHSPGAPNYVLADRFFQAAFGGSFLNHQYLVAAQAPIYTNPVSNGSKSDLHSVLDTNGFPNASYPLYTSTDPNGKDGALTQGCNVSTTRPDLACGDYAVNTIQPASQPYSPADDKRLPLLKTPTIGDRLSSKGISWAWYAGGWDNAAGIRRGPGPTDGIGTPCLPTAFDKATHPYCPDPLFQFHHQPFNNYEKYRAIPDAEGRETNPERLAHLEDERDFRAAVAAGTLPAVSFVKPIGAQNEHPGYASESEGGRYLVDLVRAVADGPQARDTLVVVTYDEFGGQWDHVPPPGQGGATPGPHDRFGPGTRVPALIISRSLPHSAVDHTSYDTTSILATIEHGFGLAPLSSRDVAVSDLSPALAAAGEHVRSRPSRSSRRMAERSR